MNKILLLLFVLIIYSSCTTKGRKVDEPTSERIKIKEFKTIGGRVYHLIEVDSVEYLFQYNGGAVRIGEVK